MTDLRVYLHRMKFMRALVLAAVLVCCSSNAWSQAAEFTVHGGVSRLNGKDLGSGYSLDDGWRAGGRLTLNTGLFFGHEVGYAYNRTTLLLDNQEFGGMAIHQGFYNFLVYPVPEGLPVRPFVTGGAHFSNFVPPGTSATQGGGDNKFGINYGGGVKFRVGPKWMMRVDFRQYSTGKPFDLPGRSGRLRQNEISVGFGIGL
jgi:opacity protein-like surface antigen